MALRAETLEATMRAVWQGDFLGKKIRFAWSQTRGGIAIFASGRMEGELFDSEDEAREWLLKCGVTIGTDGRGAKVYTPADVMIEENLFSSLRSGTRPAISKP
jgi:hypothetical protein